jgi:hypothetical protein
VGNRRERRAEAAHVGRPTVIKALGRPWKAGRVERRHLVAFCEEYASKYIVDPVDVASKMLARLPREYHEQIVAACQNDAGVHLTWDDPRVQQMSGKPLGMAYILYLSLRDHHEEMTPDIAWKIFMEVGEREARRAIDRATGRPPAPKAAAGSPDSRPANPDTDLPGPPTGPTSTPSCSGPTA